MTFANVYADAERARSYARLEFPGTYYLAYRDLPALVAAHVHGRRGLDFGCGAGRSTRFLRRLGFAAVGVDVSAEMIRMARELDPEGDYRLVATEPAALGEPPFDLVLSAFTLDNVLQEAKTPLLRGLAAVLAPEGRILNLVSNPEIYTNEWASFSTRDFPGNRCAVTGDVVRIVMTDVADRRPVEDVLCTEEAYGAIYRDAGIRRLAVHRPLGRADEPFPWVNETKLAPWRVDVLARA
jgi:SAM-dependent methyltransferase